MATISSLTQLTTAASGDRLAVDDVSANVTKYMEVKDLAGHGYGQLHHISSDGGGSAATTSTPTSYTNLNFSTNGETGGATPDFTTDSVTLPSTGGLFRLEYSLTVSSNQAAGQRVYFRLYDGSALVAGSERSFTSKAANYADNVAAAVIYSSSGSEVITVQTKASTGSVTLDGGALIATPIPASA